VKRRRGPEWIREGIGIILTNRSKGLGGLRGVEKGRKKEGDGGLYRPMTENGEQAGI